MKVITAKTLPKIGNAILLTMSAEIIFDDPNNNTVVIYKRQLKPSTCTNSFKAYTKEEVEGVIDWFHEKEKLNEFDYELKHDFKIVNSF